MGSKATVVAVGVGLGALALWAWQRGQAEAYEQGASDATGGEASGGATPGSVFGTDSGYEKAAQDPYRMSGDEGRAGGNNPWSWNPDGGSGYNDVWTWPGGTGPPGTPRQSLYQSAKDEFRSSPIFTTSIAAGGLATGAAALYKTFGRGAATGGLRGATSAGSAATRGAAAAGGVRAAVAVSPTLRATLTQAAPKAAQAAYVGLGVVQAGVGLGQTAGAVYAATQGDKAKAQTLSSKAVAGGTSFLSLGAASITPKGPAPGTSQVRILGMTKTVTPPKSVPQAFSNVGKNIGKVGSKIGGLFR